MSKIPEVKETNTIRDFNENDLIREMKIFGMLNQEIKNELFLLAVKNSILFYSIHYNLEDKYFTLPDFMNKYKKDNNFIEFIIEKYGIDINIIKNKSKVVKFDEIRGLYEILKLYGYSLLEISIYINIYLYINNCVPITFGFNGCWNLNFIKDIKSMNELIETTIFLMYSMVESTKKVQIMEKANLYSNLGAKCNVYVNNIEKETYIYKIPKNLASFRYISKKEKDNYDILSNTCIKKFLPKKYMYDEKLRIIIHTFIDGITGEAWLKKNVGLNDKQISSLEEFYNKYRKLNHLEFCLDLHPGNFVWLEDDEIWKLIDLGAIPILLYSSYNYEKFTDYFMKIWIERKNDIIRYPIKTFDFNVDEKILQKSKIKKCIITKNYQIIEI